MLFYSVYYNYRNITMFLLQRGIDYKLANLKGYTVYHVGCYKGSLESLQLVIQY